MNFNLGALLRLALHYSLPHRANRQEWWSAHIVAITISFILGILPLIVWETIEFLSVVGLFPKVIAEHLNALIEIILIVVIAIPILYTSLVVSIKRLHDLGHSGFWWLINLLIIPIPFFILYLGLAKSKTAKE